MKKTLYVLLGYLSIALGVIGIFVPLMPTTCFLIAAVWCFYWADRERVGQLLQHKRLGPLINRIHPRFLPRL